MTTPVVQDWLSEWSCLDAGQIHSYAAVLDHNEELLHALQAVLEEPTRYVTLLDPVCDQLFSFYRSREPALQRFTLQLLPSLMHAYLSAVASGDKKRFKGVETLLLGMHNLEVVTGTGEAVVLSFRLPSLAQASLYHEPTREAITESALRRYEEVNTKPVTWGPHAQAEQLNAQNRLRVLTNLLFVYNRHMGTFQKFSLRNFCRQASRIVTQGFPRVGHHQRSTVVAAEAGFVPKLPPRIPINAKFLLELLSGLYCAMYNDFGSLAMQAVEDIYHRSCFECLSDVIIVANAIKSCSHFLATGQPADTSLDISMALSPATTTVTTVNKSMITNASFRTKKLPEDIPIISGEEGALTNEGAQSSHMASISEEKEEESSNFTPRAASLRGKDAVTKNLQKLGIGKKPKTKAVGEKTPVADKKGKSVKSPSQNGDTADGVELQFKRRSTVENGDGPNIGAEKSDASLSLESHESIDMMDEPIRRLDSSPTSHKKIVDLDDKPLMQVSSV